MSASMSFHRLSKVINVNLQTDISHFGSSSRLRSFPRPIFLCAKTCCSIFPTRRQRPICRRSEKHTNFHWSQTTKSRNISKTSTFRSAVGALSGWTRSRFANQERLSSHGLFNGEQRRQERRRTCCVMAPPPPEPYDSLPGLA